MSSESSWSAEMLADGLNHSMLIMIYGIPNNDLTIAVSYTTHSENMLPFQVCGRRQRARAKTSYVDRIAKREMDSLT